MRTIVTMCLAGVAALSLASCACPRCGGGGVEYAAGPGVHPYTGKKYKAGEAISCLKCNGTGQFGASPGAALYSNNQAVNHAYTEQKPTKGPDIHVHEHYSTNVHEHYNTNNYVVW